MGIKKKPESTLLISILTPNNGGPTHDKPLSLVAKKSSEKKSQQSK